MKYAVFGMGLIILLLTGAVVYGMMNPPPARLAMPSTPNPATPRELVLPVDSFTLLANGGNYLLAQANLDGKTVIYVINPATMSLQGVLKSQ